MQGKVQVEAQPCSLRLRPCIQAHGSSHQFAWEHYAITWPARVPCRALPERKVRGKPQVPWAVATLIGKATASYEPVHEKSLLAGITGGTVAAQRWSNLAVRTRRGQTETRWAVVQVIT